MIFSLYQLRYQSVTPPLNLVLKIDGIFVTGQNKKTKFNKFLQNPQGDLQFGWFFSDDSIGFHCMTYEVFKRLIVCSTYIWYPTDQCKFIFHSIFFCSCSTRSFKFIVPTEDIERGMTCGIYIYQNWLILGEILCRTWSV